MDTISFAIWILAILLIVLHFIQKFDHMITFPRTSELQITWWMLLTLMIPEAGYWVSFSITVLFICQIKLSFFGLKPYNRQLYNTSAHMLKHRHLLRINEPNYLEHTYFSWFALQIPTGQLCLKKKWLANFSNAPSSLSQLEILLSSPPPTNL